MAEAQSSSTLTTESAQSSSFPNPGIRIKPYQHEGELPDDFRRAWLDGTYESLPSYCDHVLDLGMASQTDVTKVFGERIYLSMKVHIIIIHPLIPLDLSDAGLNDHGLLIYYALRRHLRLRNAQSVDDDCECVARFRSIVVLTKFIKRFTHLNHPILDEWEEHWLVEREAKQGFFLNDDEGCLVKR